MLYLWLLACALLALVCVLVLWRRESQLDQGFLTQLVQWLDEGRLHEESLLPTQIPPKFRALYRALDTLLFSFQLGGIDKLTGLANRVGIKRKLSAQMPLQQGSLVLINIRRLRYVNDLFGFVVGDELLKRFAERLLHLSHPPQLLGRMNGDEFLLYFKTQTDEAALGRMRGRLQVPFDIEGTPISVQLQLGYLQLAEHHGDVSTLLRRLDVALKKACHRNEHIAAYRRDDDKRQLRELKIINSLPKGLHGDRLYLTYQPKINVADGRCTQVEALIRWEHEELGSLSPAEFIPLAEYAGMIGLVSQWALDKVLAQQAKWRAQGINVQVALNLSPRDLERAGLAEDIASALKRYHVPAEALLIEITESGLMADIEATIGTLDRLRGLGIELAIDDFGTGHSSLAYLKQLPVNEIKIDKAFLKDLLTDKQALHIMETSILLAKKLGFEVTVEGVESPQIRDLLLTLGVDKLQGRLLAKPLSVTELEQQWPQVNRASELWQHSQ
jgi:c-di-GMP phosphodiesterase